MKIVIDCEQEHIARAMDLACQQVTCISNYSKVGWGWSFGPRPWGARFFVRRLKDGLSVRQIRDPDAKGADHG